MTPYPEFKGTSLFDVDYFGYDMATVMQWSLCDLSNGVIFSDLSNPKRHYIVQRQITRIGSRVQFIKRCHFQWPWV